MVSTGVWIAVAVVVIICIVPIFWVTNKAYSRKWEDDPSNTIDKFFEPGDPSGQSGYNEQSSQEKEPRS